MSPVLQALLTNRIYVILPPFIIPMHYCSYFPDIVCTDLQVKCPVTVVKVANPSGDLESKHLTRYQERPKCNGP